MFFKFLIYDFHYTAKLIEDEAWFVPIIEDGYFKFEYEMSYKDVSVMEYRTFILWHDQKPIVCTKVTNDNGTVLLAVDKISVFRANLNAFLKDFKEID